MKGWRHQSKSVNIIYLDEDAFLISSRVFLIAQFSAVKIDAESENISEITVSGGKTAAHASEFPSRDPSCLIFP